MMGKMGFYSCNGCVTDRYGRFSPPSIHSPLCSGFSNNPMGPCEECRAWALLSTSERCRFRLGRIWGWLKEWV